MKRLKIGFGWRRHAGLVCVWTDDAVPHWGVSVHFAVQRTHWQWGYEIDEAYFLRTFGLGPFLLVAW